MMKIKTKDCVYDQMLIRMTLGNHKTDLDESKNLIYEKYVPLTCWKYNSQSKGYGILRSLTLKLHEQKSFLGTLS